MKLKWDLYEPKEQQKDRRWKLAPTLVSAAEAGGPAAQAQDGGGLQQTVVQADKR